ncbi:hypothetical protein SNARM312S_03970 [Streptomyces narbonensis]
MTGLVGFRVTLLPESLACVVNPSAVDGTEEASEGAVRSSTEVWSTNDSSTELTSLAVPRSRTRPTPDFRPANSEPK